MNCVDFLGRLVLFIAIENENIEMIEVLLNYNVEVGDSFLYVINEENVEVVELIFNYEVVIKGEEVMFIFRIEVFFFNKEIKIYYYVSLVYLYFDFYRKINSKIFVIDGNN